MTIPSMRRRATSPAMAARWRRWWMCGPKARRKPAICRCGAAGRRCARSAAAPFGRSRSRLRAAGGPSASPAIWWRWAAAGLRPCICSASRAAGSTGPRRCRPSCRAPRPRPSGRSARPPGGSTSKAALRRARRPGRTSRASSASRLPSRRPRLRRRRARRPCRSRRPSVRARPSSISRTMSPPPMWRSPGARACARSSI